jgi:hypothetical protein
MPEEPGISRFSAFRPEQDAVQKANDDMRNPRKHDVFGYKKWQKSSLEGVREARQSNSRECMGGSVKAAGPGDGSSEWT